MKKVMLLILILVCNYSFAQTKDLQLSIDSFRSVINEQNIRINQLEGQVHNLYKVFNTFKNVLNDSSIYNESYFQARKHTTKNSLKSTTENTKTSGSNHDFVKSKRTSSSTSNEYKIKSGPKGGKYLRTINGRKYYVTSNGKKYFVMPNGKIVWVNR